MLTLAFISSACFAISTGKGIESPKNSYQVERDGCSVSNTGSSTIFRECNGVIESYTFYAECSVESSSCEAGDLYQAGIEAGVCATLRASKEARRQSQFLPACDGGGGGQP